MKRLLISTAIETSVFLALVFVPACSSSAKQDIASCAFGSPYTMCIDYSPASTGIGKQACESGGGYWSMSGCDPSMAVGGCRSNVTGMSTTTTWYGDVKTSASLLRANCSPAMVVAGGVALVDGSVPDEPVVATTFTIGACSFRTFATTPCNDLELEAAAVANTGQVAPLTAQGGTLVDGVYDFVQGAGGGNGTRATIAIARGATLFEMVYEFSGGSEERISHTIEPPLVANPTYFPIGGSCDPLGDFNLQIDYTATDKTFILGSGMWSGAMFQRRCP